MQRTKTIMVAAKVKIAGNNINSCEDDRGNIWNCTIYTSFQRTKNCYSIFLTKMISN